MAHFNKRHYEAIAKVMQRVKLELDTESHDVNIALTVIERELADTFKSDNGQFDRSRFLHACKPGSNVKARTAHLKIA